LRVRIGISKLLYSSLLTISRDNKLDSRKTAQGIGRVIMNDTHAIV
jgi:hypothetical protein